MGVENRLVGASGLIYTAGESTDASGRAVRGGGGTRGPRRPKRAAQDILSTKQSA